MSLGRLTNGGSVFFLAIMGAVSTAIGAADLGRGNDADQAPAILMLAGGIFLLALAGLVVARLLQLTRQDNSAS